MSNIKTVRGHPKEHMLGGGHGSGPAATWAREGTGHGGASSQVHLGRCMVSVPPMGSSLTQDRGED